MPQAQAYQKSISSLGTAGFSLRKDSHYLKNKYSTGAILQLLLYIHRVLIFVYLSLKERKMNN